MSQVAILLATYNGAAYLRELLDSLENQTRVNFRVWIHDDGSRDETIDIINEYCNRAPDRYALVDGPKGLGSKRSFLYLLEQVEADYYFFCDQDDVWLPDKVQTLLDALVGHSLGDERPLAAFCDMKVVDGKLNVLCESFLDYMGRSGTQTRFSQILIDNPAAGCSMAFNRALRDRCLPLPNADNIEMHDAWVMMMAAVYGEICFVPSPLVLYRQHGDNVLGAATESRLQKVLRNIEGFLSGSLARQKRNFFATSRRLAAEVLTREDIPDEVRRVLEGYLDLEKHSRRYRIRFCKDNQINRAHHSLWMWLWI
ncbi:MAG: glycosyltransferase family 2 protein [Lachnospiraceae bacterium]|nr:glycosyltransferase family 2 protein [Lachnospiraceae bacterium]MBQ1722134.1 glycosyltransferase family 2 protein [Lachnospiraceae bacterium]